VAARRLLSQIPAMSESLCHMPVTDLAKLGSWG
jgi:hypothetical protein